MTSQKGRDLLLKIGNGAAPEVFTTIGAARTTAMSIDNQAVDATTIADAGIQSMQGDAGTQSMKIRLDGLFKDSAAEELLRAAAFARANCNYKLYFPHGDHYAASFVIDNYSRTGTHDGLESFSVSLTRSGAGSFTTGE